MSTHNIQFHDKKKKKKKKKKKRFFFLELLEEFRRDSKRVRISHCKRAIGVRAIEVRRL